MKTNKLVFLLASTIILLGFSLRLYQLGTDGFWNDELGQLVDNYAKQFEQGNTDYVWSLVTGSDY